jgi:hypothetical protein
MSLTFEEMLLSINKASLQIKMSKDENKQYFVEVWDLNGEYVHCSSTHPTKPEALTAAYNYLKGQKLI